MVLLDEPLRGLTDEDRGDLLRRLHQHAERGAAIVITHDLDFARRASDDVCLLCEGRVVAHRAAKDFFDRPEGDLERQFVEFGSCSLSPPEPSLPRHFFWLEEGSLAGMGRPGLLRELDDDLFAIAYAGVTLLVSLTEDPMPSVRLRPFGIHGRHFPIPDMGVPRFSDTLALCNELARALDRGEGVAVHCRAGLGRTGTILACLAVWMGARGEEAIDRVRQRAPRAIQTEEQEAFVFEFEARR